MSCSSYQDGFVGGKWLYSSYFGTASRIYQKKKKKKKRKKKHLAFLFSFRQAFSPRIMLEFRSCIYTVVLIQL